MGQEEDIGGGHRSPWYLLPPITTFHVLLRRTSGRRSCGRATARDFLPNWGGRITIVSIDALSDRKKNSSCGARWRTVSEPFASPNRDFISTPWPGEEARCKGGYLVVETQLHPDARFLAASTKDNSKGSPFFLSSPVPRLYLANLLPFTVLRDSLPIARTDAGLHATLHTLLHRHDDDITESEIGETSAT